MTHDLNDNNKNTAAEDSTKNASSAEYTAPAVSSVSDQEVAESMTVVHAGSLINP